MSDNGTEKINLRNKMEVQSRSVIFQWNHSDMNQSMIQVLLCTVSFATEDVVQVVWLRRVANYRRENI